MILYIIRHGQSLNNALGDSHNRVCDPPLTEIGEAQARCVAGYLRATSDKTDGQNGTGYGITRLYCSPMLRALQTTAPIAEALGLTPEIWIDVHEEQGIWLDEDDGRGPVGLPGLGRSEMAGRFPGVVLPEAIPDSGWWDRPPETDDDVAARVVRVAHALRGRCAEADPDERLAIVSHGGFTNKLVQALVSGGVLAGIYFSNHNTAINRFDFMDEAFVRIRYLNRVEHLASDLLT